MRIAMLSLVLLLDMAQTGKPVLPATDVPASVIEATLREMIASGAVDTPIRTVDAGGHHVGIGLVHRKKGSNLAGGASHDLVTEVYHVLEGAGTLVTGGTLIEPERRASGDSRVVTINGPGWSGKGIQGGTRRRIAKGDVVIIPAGTPHWFPEVEADLTYTVVRVDPARVVQLK